mgnify:FL=1
MQEFYVAYIRAGAHPRVGTDTPAMVKKRFCTPALLQRLDAATPEADPFVQAQDVLASWEKTLSITQPDPSREEYRVCVDPSVPDLSCVVVGLTREGEGYKIDQLR